MMNNLLSVLKKYRFVTGGLIVGLIVIVAWSTRKKEFVETPTIKKNTFEMLKIESLENKVGKINWNVNKIEIPQKMALISNKTGKVGSVELLKIGEWLGAEGMLKSIDANGLLSYKNPTTGTSIYINQANNVVQFSRGILDENYFSNTLRETDIALAENDLKSFIEKLQSWIVGGSFSTIEKSYQKISGPRAVTSTKSDSNLAVLVTSINVNGIRLYTSYGSELVTARYGKEGRLLELKMENPRLNLKAEEEVNTISFDEAVSNLNRLKVFKVYGPEEYEIGNQSDNLEEINITSANLAYVYTPANNRFVPFLIGEGNCKLSSGPARVRVGVWLQKD